MIKLLKEKLLIRLANDQAIQKKVLEKRQLYITDSEGKPLLIMTAEYMDWVTELGMVGTEGELARFDTFKVYWNK